MIETTVVELTPILVGLIPVTIGLVEVVRRLLPKEKHDRLLPLFALLFGIIGGVFFTNLDTTQAVLSGIIVGLSASGLYSQGRSLSKKELSTE